MAATTEAYNCGCGGPNPTSNVHLDPDVWGTWSGEQFTPNATPENTVCDFGPDDNSAGPFQQQYVLPTLPKGTFEHQDPNCGPCTPRITCPLVKCPRDFGGFVINDTVNTAIVNANQGAINRLTIGTSLQFDRACEPLLGGTPPAVFPLPIMEDAGIANPCNAPEVDKDTFLREVYYTVNAIVQRLQNVGILANYTASKGHSIFRSIGHLTDSTDQEFPQSNRELFTAIGNATKKCYGTPRIYLSDIYLYVQELQDCAASADPASNKGKVLRAQISCLNNLLANWANTFGVSTDSIDQHRFIRWYEENCYSCC